MVCRLASRRQHGTAYGGRRCFQAKTTICSSASKATRRWDGSCARHWLPACLSEEVAEPDGTPVRDPPARRGPRRVPRHARAGSACSTSIARTAAHRSHSAATRNAGCAASITAGSSTLTATSSTARRSRPAAAPRQLKHGPIRRANPAASSGSGWASGRRRAEFEPPAWAPSPDTRISIVKIHVDCNWAQVLEGAIDSAHSSSLHSSDMVPATSTAPRRPTTLAAALDRQGAAHAVQRTQFGFRYAAIRRPIENADTHDYVRITLFVAPFTVLIPPNDHYNCRS